MEINKTNSDKFELIKDLFQEAKPIKSSKKEKKNERNESKVTKKKLSKNDRKYNKASMEIIQEKLP